MTLWKRVAQWFRPKSQVREATQKHDAAYLRFMLEVRHTQDFFAEMAREQAQGKKNNEHH